MAHGHLCPRLHAATKFTIFTIFRYSLRILRNSRKLRKITSSFRLCVACEKALRFGVWVLQIQITNFCTLGRC